MTKIENRGGEAQARTQVELRPIRSGDKVVRDTASHDQGKVRLGEGAPAFGP